MHSFNGIGSLQYNFYVTPPTGSEYTVLVTPTWQSSVTLPALPIGVSSIRAVAIDVTYASPRLGRPIRRGSGMACSRPHAVAVPPAHACRSARSGDRTYTDYTTVNVTASTVNTTVLTSLLSTQSTS